MLREGVIQIKTRERGHKLLLMLTWQCCVLNMHLLLLSYISNRWNIFIIIFVLIKKILWFTMQLNEYFFSYVFATTQRCCCTRNYIYHARVGKKLRLALLWNNHLKERTTASATYTLADELEKTFQCKVCLRNKVYRSSLFSDFKARERGEKVWTG